MKNVLLVVLLLISIFFLIPVGMLDLLLGGSVTPFKSFVVPAFWAAWNSQSGSSWLRKVPRPFSWLIQVFLTIIAVIAFWGVMIYRPLFALFGFFLRQEALSPEVQGLPASSETTPSSFELRSRAAASKVKKFALATSRAAAAVPSRMRNVTGLGLGRADVAPVAYEGDIPIYPTPETEELQEVIL